MMEGRFVAYYRVSTEKQDADCAAQHRAVEAYLNGGGWQLLDEFAGVETGKGRRCARAAARARAGPKS